MPGPLRYICSVAGCCSGSQGCRGQHRAGQEVLGAAAGEWQAFTASSTPGTGSQSGHASGSSCPCKLPVPWDPAAAGAQTVQGSPCRLGEVRGVSGHPRGPQLLQH